MKYIERKKQYIFDNDSDFENFAINPTIQINYSEKDTPYYDWSWSEAYLCAIKNAETFVILDEKSLIMKKGCITHRLISKKVQNLVEVF